MKVARHLKLSPNRELSVFYIHITWKLHCLGHVPSTILPFFSTISLSFSSPLSLSLFLVSFGDRLNGIFKSLQVANKSSSLYFHQSNRAYGRSLKISTSTASINENWDATQWEQIGESIDMTHVRHVVFLR